MIIYHYHYYFQRCWIISTHYYVHTTLTITIQKLHSSAIQKLHSSSISLVEVSPYHC